ncbi:MULTISPECIES: DUF6194 family protein [unclassified Nocardiopsis]|uniref:DUF6194 family protein n=1 Tax=unclassified Nocardiopsis TaxID=2649073 RepID=UPI0033F26AEF
MTHLKGGRSLGAPGPGEGDVVDQDEVLGFVRGLDGVRVMTAGVGDGSPEIAWGDSFFLYEPDGRARDRAGFAPFATLVTKDYPGFDTASRLDRPGVFRVNAAVGRVSFEEVVGRSPAAYAGSGRGCDASELDRFLPHPVYAAQGWVSVLNPGPRTADRTRELLVLARARAVARYRARG